jgi:hypothetical protein
MSGVVNKSSFGKYCFGMVVGQITINGTAVDIRQQLGMSCCRPSACAGWSPRDSGQLTPMQTQSITNMPAAVAKLRKLRLFGADARGLAGIDFVITGMMLVLGLVNAADVGLYVYKRMEAENAADVGAQAAWEALQGSKSNAAKPTP